MTDVFIAPRVNRFHRSSFFMPHAIFHMLNASMRQCVSAPCGATEVMALWASNEMLFFFIFLSAHRFLCACCGRDTNKKTASANEWRVFFFSVFFCFMRIEIELRRMFFNLVLMCGTSKRAADWPIGHFESISAASRRKLDKQSGRAARKQKVSRMRIESMNVCSACLNFYYY